MLNPDQKTFHSIKRENQGSRKQQLNIKSSETLFIVS